jgi:PadR family transcriptional regulator, regulatory protein PadR
MEKRDLPQGTLDRPVLRVLSGGEMDGWGIAHKLSLRSKGALPRQEGTLCPALYRMQAKGRIAAERTQSDSHRRAKLSATDEARPKTARRGTGKLGRLAEVVTEILKEA